MFRVIIVDHDPMVRYINRSFVEQNPAFRVVGEFGSGKELMGFFNSHSADLMILELNMPDCNGLDLLRDIRARCIDIDIILITAVSDAKTMGKALRLGVIDYLVKPFKPVRFQQSLDRYMRYMQALSSDAGTGLLTMDYRAHSASMPNKGIQDATLEKLMERVRMSTRGCSVEELAESMELSRVTVRRYMKHLADTGKVVSTINYHTGGRPCIIYHIA